MKQFCKIHFTILLILTFLLSGCTKKDPVETIVDNQTQHIGEVLDYAYNNFEQTVEIKMLENELDSCIVVLEATKNTYFTAMGKCDMTVKYWRLASFGLFVLLMLGVFAKIKRWL